METNLKNLISEHCLFNFFSKYVQVQQVTLSKIKKFVYMCRMIESSHLAQVFFVVLVFCHHTGEHTQGQLVQYRSSIGLSQLLLVFTTLEQVVWPVASSRLQLEQAVAYSAG
jgi:hypothetical protein